MPCGSSPGRRKRLEAVLDQELSRFRLLGRTHANRQATIASTPTVKQHLASLRMLFDWLIIGQVIDANPAAAVRAAKHVVKKGKTPVLKADQARELLDSIPLKIGPEPKEGEEDNRPPSLIGLRDRALIAVMVFSFARVTAALGMKVEDYYTEGRRAWFRLHEKGGKRHEVPAHHNAEDYLDAYIAAAGIAADRKIPLFRSIDRHRQLTARPMSRIDAWKMIKRRAKAIGLPEEICNHTFRATGITAYLRTAARSSMPSRSPTTNRPKPPSSMTAPAIRLRSMRSRRSLFKSVEYRPDWWPRLLCWREPMPCGVTMPCSSRLRSKSIRKHHR